MSKISSDSIRVRFAPSPTGFLHIGGTRTALFNWLFARHHGGKFLLRIEDTDEARSEDRFTQDIQESMKWLGLDWDEEVVFQSQNKERYQQSIQKLLEGEGAYACTCTSEEIERDREQAQKEGRKPMYSRRCRDRKGLPPEGTPYVIRARFPLSGTTEFEDRIRGRIAVENKEIDDFVIVRSSGVPTYQFVVVVDDALMGITDVIRGEDHINNTPKQIFLYQALGFSVPRFAHLPMIFGSDKKKLSKRHGAVSTNVYREKGYLPETLLSFLARLGWSHGDDEIFSRSQLIELFSLDSVQKSGAVFNSEKLDWLNGHFIREAEPKRICQILIEDFGDRLGSEDKEVLKTQRGEKWVALAKEKVKLLPEMEVQLRPLFNSQPLEIDSAAAQKLKWNKNPDLKAKIKEALRKGLGDLDLELEGKADRTCLGDLGWTHERVDSFLRGLASEQGVKLGDMASALRLCVAGSSSVGLFDLLPTLPWSQLRPRWEQVLGL